MKTRARFITTLGVLVTLGLIAASCSHSDSASTTTYDAPGALEVVLPVPDVRQGTILDKEELDLGSGVVAYRILYASRNIQEDAPIAVSGYVVSKSSGAPEGGWPLIAWAHGTVGLGDSCAPSNDLENDRPLWEGLLDAGYAVVATDYEGLGTPGLHPYVVGESEARGVFDSVRAVQNHDGELPGINVTDEWVVWGHSQGGHAAMFVSETWQEYAAELNLLGAVAGAPPSQFPLLYDALLGGPFQGYIVMATAAAAESYGIVLEDFLAQPALDRLDVLETGCTLEIFNEYNSLTPQQLTPHDNPLAIEPLKSVVEKMDSATLSIQVPTLIIHGTADEQIIPISSALLMGRQCFQTDDIPLQRLTYEGATHGSVIPASLDDMLAWIAARFAGETAPTDCT